MVGAPADPYLGLYAAIGGDHGSTSAVLEDISQQLEQVVGRLLTWADALQRACAGPHAAQLTAAPNSSQGVVGVVPASNGPAAVAAPAPAAAAAGGDAERQQAQACTAGIELTEASGPAGLCEPPPEAAAAGAAAAGAAAAPAAVAGIRTASVATGHTPQGATAAVPAAAPAAAAAPPGDAQACEPPPPPHQHGQGGHIDSQPAPGEPPAPAVPPEGPHDQVQRIQLWALVLVQALHDCTNSLDAAMGLFGGLTAGSRTFPTSHDLFLRGLAQQRRAAERASQASKLQAAAHQLQQLLSLQGPLPAGGGGNSVWVQMSAALGQGAAQVAAANGQLLQALCWWLGWEGAPEECPLAQATFDTETWFHTLHQRHAQQGRRVAPFAVQLAAQDKAPLQALVNQLASLLKEARKQVPTAAGVDLAGGRRQLFAQKEVGQLLQLQSVPLLEVPPEDNPASASAAAATAPLVQGLSVLPPGADPKQQQQQQQQEQNQEQQQEQLQATSQLWELVLGEAYQELSTSVEALVSLQLDHLGSSDLLQPDHRSMYLVWLQHLGAVEVTLRRVRRLAAAIQQQQQRQQEEQQGWQQQLGQQGWQQHHGQQQPLVGTGAQLLTVTQKLLESLQLRLLWPHPAAQHPAVAAARGGDAVDSFFTGRAAQQAQQAPGEAAAAAAAAGDLRFSLTRGLQVLKGGRVAWHNRCTLLADSLGTQAAQVDRTAAKKVLYGATLQELEAWPLHCRPIPMLQQTTGVDLGQTCAVQAAGGTAAGGAYEAGSSSSSSFDKAGQRNRLSGVADAPPAAAKVGPEVQQPSGRRNPASRSESGAALAAGSGVGAPAMAQMPQGAANKAAAGPAAAADGVGQTVATAPGPGSTNAAGKTGRPSKPVPTAAAVAAAAAAAAAGVGRKRPTPPSSGAPAKRHLGVSQQPPQSASGAGDTTHTSSAQERSGRNSMPAAAAAPQQNRGLWNVGNGIEDAARAAGKRPSSSSSGSPVAAKRAASSVLPGEGAAPAAATAAAQAQGVAGSNVPGQACVSNPIMRQLMQATRGAGRQSPTAKSGSKAALIKSSKIAASAAAAAYGAHAGLSTAGNSKASRTQSPAPAAASGAAAAAAATERRGSGGPASSSDGGPPTSGGEDGTGVAPAAHADVIILGPPESPTVPTAAAAAAAAAAAGAERPAAAGGAGDQAVAAGVTINACPAAAPSQPSSEDSEEPGQLLPALLERKLPKAVAEAEMERCAAVAREQAVKDREAQRRRREAEVLKQARAQARLQELHAEGQKRAAAEAAREVIRTEVRHQLDDLLGRAVRMLDLRAVLRALGLLTGRARSKAALLQAYKAARVQYHPDKWTRAEVRQQVYAEEVSKILNSRDLQDTL